MKHLPRNRRAGFTLIEILIVIAIIVILVSLLLGAVFYAYAAMKRTGAASEINQLNASLEAFKAKYGVYPPSRIQLHSNYDNYGNSPLDTASIAFINRMWPNIGNSVWSVKAGGSGINWAGNGKAVDEILEGDQCLVFFLGGIPNPIIGSSPQTFNDSWGFSVNPKDPSDAANANTKVGKVAPFYAFSTNRLYVRNGSYFPSFNDYYTQVVPVPYLYFSANNVKNGYPAGYSITLLDNSGKNVTVQAYFQSAGPPVLYQNSDTCQIVCAGGDGMFGVGGLWTPAMAATVYPAAPRNPGVDDQTNFYGNLMGVTQ